MAITLEQLDQHLEDWKKKIDLVGQNLIDLHSLSTYQRLTGELGFPKANLVGITRSRVDGALDAMNSLFQHFDLLTITIHQAVEARRQVKRFGLAEKILEIEFLLTGNSIQLPVIPIPLEQRALLTDPETATAIAPDQLLAAMTHAFESAKDVVLAVDTAWANLEAKLAQADAEIQTLQSLAASLGSEPGGELEALHREIEPLREQIECDPLAVSGEFDQRITPLIGQTRFNLEQRLEQRVQIQTSLQAAKEALSQLMSLNQQAIAAFAESQEKVVDHEPVATPLPEAHIEAISQWLTRLEVKFSEKLFKPVQIGLQNWHQQTAAAIAIEHHTLLAHQQLVNTRQELRGRLEALKAKALAKGVIEDATLSGLAEQAKELLYRRPTPLNQAAEVVRQYERRLNG
jgi:hypothetical protein